MPTMLAKAFLCSAGAGSGPAHRAGHYRERCARPKPPRQRRSDRAIAGQAVCGMRALSGTTPSSGPNELSGLSYAERVTGTEAALSPWEAMNLGER